MTNTDIINLTEEDITEVEDILKYLKKGFIIFEKNDIIVMEKAPQFGEITIDYQNNKYSYLIKKETKK